MEGGVTGLSEGRGGGGWKWGGRECVREEEMRMGDVVRACLCASTNERASGKNIVTHDQKCHR